MTRTILALSTALSILAITPAFAQTAAATVDCSLQVNAANSACMLKLQPNTGQTQTKGQDGTTTTTTTTQQGLTMDSAARSAAALIIPADCLNSTPVISANDYIGKTVYDMSGNNIGDVNDLIISGDGQVQAVILGVGGFLGMGEKDVAVNTQAVQMVQDGTNAKRLVVDASRDALNAAPAYDRSARRYVPTASTPVAIDQTGTTTLPTGKSGMVDCTNTINKADPACTNQTQQQ
jgi:sporulation protein YlmC with PRC-barrel domain